MTERRRIGIVSQHLDKIGADNATSVGICSRGLAAVLADSFDVAIYGRQNATSEQDLPGVSLRFIPETRGDHRLRKVFRRTRRFLKLLNRGYPITTSTARIASPFWGREVARDLMDWKPDLVLVQHNAWRVGPIKTLLPNVPVVLHLHQSIYPQELTQGYRKAAMKADYVTAVSPFIAEAVEGSLGRPVSVIRNGVNSTFFDIERKPQQRGPNIVFCGAVSPEKGAHVLVQAFSRVLHDFPDARLTLVGGVGARVAANMLPNNNDPLLEKIRPLYQCHYRQMLLSALPPSALDRVTFTGQIGPAEVRKQLASADLLVLPSIVDESFGLPVVEAMAAGVPVIVSESGAMPWLVDEGRAGVVVPKDDPEAIVRAVADLWANADRRKAIAEAGRDRCHTSFTWSRAAEDLLSIQPELASSAT